MRKKSLKTGMTGKMNNIDDYRRNHRSRNKSRKSNRFHHYMVCNRLCTLNKWSGHSRCRQWRLMPAHIRSFENYRGICRCGICRYTLVLRLVMVMGKKSRSGHRHIFQNKCGRKGNNYAEFAPRYNLLRFSNILPNRNAFDYLYTTHR